MQPTHQGQKTSKKSGRYFCGFKRRARSPRTTESKTPPQNASPIATTTTQQSVGRASICPPVGVSIPSHRQIALLQSSAEGTLSRDPSSPDPQSRGNQLATSLQAVSLQAPVSQNLSSESSSFQATPLQSQTSVAYPSQSPVSQERPSPTALRQVARPTQLPPPSPKPKTSYIPKLSPLFFQKLLSLPREIRDIIWRQVLRDLNLATSIPSNQIRKALPAFCHINKQVFCETVPLFLRLCSIRLRSKEDAKKLFQFLNHVPSSEAYTGVRSLQFENCWAWTSTSAIPFLREVLAKCTRVQHITLEVTQKFIYEPIYFNPPGARGPPPSRSEYRKQYIRGHLFSDIDRLFLHDTADLKTVRLRGSGKHDALQLSKPPRKMQAKDWLDHLDWSGTVDDPKPLDALLEMEFAEWKQFIEGQGKGCSQWMQDLMNRVPLTTYDAAHFTGSFSYSFSAASSPQPISSSHTSSTQKPSFPTSTSPLSDLSIYESFAHIPLFFPPTSPRSRPTIYESSDYYSPSGYEAGSYEGSGYDLPHPPDRPSGFWSSGARSPGYNSSGPQYRADFIRPGL